MSLFIGNKTQKILSLIALFKQKASQVILPRLRISFLIILLNGLDVNLSIIAPLSSLKENFEDCKDLN
jgi:hypothetical protein